MNKLLLALVVTMALISSANAECDYVAEKECVRDADTPAGYVSQACAALAVEAKCNQANGCWPEFTYLGVSVNAKDTCLMAAAITGCNATTCDSGSMATPMVSLFAVIAAMLYQLM
jgi:hypothetical protein